MLWEGCLLNMSSSLLDSHRANWQSLRARGIYHYKGIENINRLFPNSFAEGMIFSLICRQSRRKFAYIGIDCDSCDHSCASVSVSSLAKSLSRPNETVRRQIQKIEDDGYISRINRVIDIDQTGEKRDEIAHFIRKTYNDFIDYIGALARADDMLAGKPGLSDRLAIRAKLLETALDIYIVPMATHVGTFKEWIYGNVWTGIAVDSIRHIEEDDTLAQTYRFINTPDELRRDVSLRSVAMNMNLAYPTAWRAAQYLKGVNLIVQTKEGWNVTSENLKSKSLPEADKAYFQYLSRELRQLIALGFDPADAQSYRI